MMICPKCNRKILSYEYVSEDIDFDIDRFCISSYVVCPDCKSSWLVSEVYTHEETLIEPCDEDSNIIEKE